MYNSTLKLDAKNLSLFIYSKLFYGKYYVKNVTHSIKIYVQLHFDYRILLQKIYQYFIYCKNTTLKQSLVKSLEHLIFHVLSHWNFLSFHFEVGFWQGFIKDFPMWRTFGIHQVVETCLQWLGIILKFGSFDRPVS